MLELTKEDKKNLANVVLYFILFLVLMMAIIFMRYDQKKMNKKILNNKIFWDYSSIKIDILKTHHVGLFRKIYHYSNKPCWDIMSNSNIYQQLSNEELKNYLKLFHFYKMSKFEKKYLDYIKDNLAKDGYLGLFKSHICKYLYNDIFDEFEAQNFENARYQAQRFINYAYAIPPDIFYENNAYKLSRAREFCEYVYGIFPYSNDNAEDRINYRKLADSSMLNNYADDELMWIDFIDKYSDSPRKDEAEFNVINNKLRFIKSESEGLELINCIDEFINKYKESYLADDACWYAMLVASEFGLQDIVFKNFNYIVSNYSYSDHFKRLRYKIMDWLVSYYGYPSGIAKKITDFIFSLPKYKYGEMSSAIDKYSYDKETKEMIVETVRFFINRHREIYCPESSISIDGRVESVTPVIVQLWALEARNQ